MDKRTFLKNSLILGCSTLLLNRVGAINIPTASKHVLSPSTLQSNKAKLFVWGHGSNTWTYPEWIKYYESLKSYGISEVILGEDESILSAAIPPAKEAGIKIHAWTWIMNRPSDKEAAQHPEWFQVNRKGESCFDKPPYVGYYKWVCPNKPEVQNHLRLLARRIATLEIESFHMDYVRYPDIILPEALQSKYNIVQDREFPEYDYCYCDDCKKEFKRLTGIDINQVSDPTTNIEWRKFRYNSVTKVVKIIAKEVHKKNRKLTAAVFPHPEMSRTMVRQSWSDWPLDAAFPMIYHNFYNKDINWIGETVSKGVKEIKGRFPIYAGLFLPAFKNADDLKAAIEISLKNGAAGASFFADGNLKPELVPPVSKA